MKTSSDLPLISALAVAASVWLTSALRAEAPAEIARFKGDPASPILTGVEVPPGATLLYLSGQVPAVADTTKPSTSIEAYGDTKAQAVSVFHKIEGLLAKQGYGLGDVIKLTVFLVGDPKNGNKLDFKGFSEAYAQFFGTAAQPNLVARSTVQVAALANPGFLVEIEATAARRPPPQKTKGSRPAP
jgi:enamine deaminase RidA (YjgF/YER057c/UK114 family)